MAIAPADVHRARTRELDVPTFYSLLRLRVDVFVVEQNCPYQELDGRDTEASTWHLWTADEHGPTSYLRLLGEADGEADGPARIGRVCTRADVRGAGLAARLMEATLGIGGQRAIVLDAQTRLADWYRRWGFSPSGPEFVEDGIPHVPMRRPPSNQGP